MALDPGTRTILAVSGSLRARSSNARLLRLASEIAPPGAMFEFFEGFEQLPHFNPDLDTEDAIPVPPLARWRAAVRSADGILVSCPEYAHGVPGAFKNALDWLVSSADMMGKPAVLLNASPSGGEFAQPSLAETLRLIGANVLEGCSQMRPFLPPGFLKDPTDPCARDAIRGSVEGLLAALKS